MPSHFPTCVSQARLALSLAGAATPFVMNSLRWAKPPRLRRRTTRAVCVFLYGGNDYANTLVAQ